jgi:hypothetical protein
LRAIEAYSLRTNATIAPVKKPNIEATQAVLGTSSAIGKKGPTK